MTNESLNLISSILKDKYAHARNVGQHARALAISKAHEELGLEPLFEPVNHKPAEDVINAKLESGELII